MADPNGNAQSNPQRPSRLEAEVAEILARAEQPASFTEHVRRKAEASAARRPAVTSLPSFQQLGPGSFLLGAFGFAILGAGINGISPLLGMLLAIASLASFAMVWIRRSPPGIGGAKTWRGRDLSPGPNTSQWVNAIRDRMKKPPRF